MPHTARDLDRVLEYGELPRLVDFETDLFGDVRIDSIPGVNRLLDVSDDERVKRRKEEKVDLVYFFAKASEQGMNPPASSRLAYYFLANYGPFTRRDLKLLLGVHRTTMDRIIGGFREVDVIVECPHPEDGRRSLFTVPDKAGVQDYPTEYTSVE